MINFVIWKRWIWFLKSVLLLWCDNYHSSHFNMFCCLHYVGVLYIVRSETTMNIQNHCCCCYRFTALWILSGTTRGDFC